MHKHSTLAAALLALVASVTAVATAAPAQAQTHCHEQYQTGEQQKNDGSTGDDDWYIRVGVYYKWCKNLAKDDIDKRHWVTPRGWSVGYNQEGTSMGCSHLFSPNYLDYVKFDSYWSGPFGENWSPPEIKLPCKKDTTASDTKLFDRSERLHFRVGKGFHPAKVRIPWTVEKAGPLFDVSGNIGIKLTK